MFGVCPHCQAVFRLADAKVSYDTPYKVDWLDELEDLQEKWDTKTDDLKEKEKFLRREAIERATRKHLPKLLSHMVPTFASSRLNPQDIKTIFHPIDFVIFDGLRQGKLDRILLMDRKSDNALQIGVQKAIEDTIKSHAIEWRTLRVNETGAVTVEE